MKSSKYKNLMAGGRGRDGIGDDHNLGHSCGQNGFQSFFGSLICSRIFGCYIQQSSCKENFSLWLKTWGGSG